MIDHLHSGMTANETEPEAAKPTLLDQIGGPWGFVYSTIPVLVFVACASLTTLPVTVAVSVATGLVLTAVRIVRGEKAAAASGSVTGVAVAAAVVAFTGSARDFFAIGIWTSLLIALATLATVIARRPVTGLVWNAVHGGGHDWRADGPSLRAHDIATLAIAIPNAVQFGVKQWLYLADDVAGLGIAKIALSTPITLVMLAVAVWAFRRTSGRLLRPTDEVLSAG
ncbi:DUF3159 domain-containing protein [Tsukamurella sp. 1534]|uniref:DUF3159 domain-containing protein n=1 Tax=Tsukamurella sp. 1534 TaxID=1151061 RepID=UPI000308F446|nr:DUF3159 domain-containing protein [Tsukamurella sp. 1534]